ncbi:MAG: hypothetical protein HRU19_25450 [Pseudobacteriovorax sp.]|nr:hypothetical protein [Pseudobacteriovorax sp.]
MSAQIREDLQQTLGPIICQNSEHSVQAFWDNELFDARVQVHKFRLKSATKKHNTEKLRNHAKQLAIRDGHKGFAFGVCDQRIVWIATTTFAESVLASKDGQLEVKLEPSFSTCRKVTIDYISYEDRRSRLIWRSRMPIESNPSPVLSPKILQPGTISITCFHKDRNWGPQLLAMAPVGQVKEIPFHHELQSGDLALATWINKIRSRFSLNSLAQELSPLATTASKLVSGEKLSIRHNRKIIEEQRNFLSEFAIRFLGENRVIGRSRAELAKLLWLSPRHRSLLLNKNATHMAISTQNSKKQKLAVIVLAKKN